MDTPPQTDKQPSSPRLYSQGFIAPTPSLRKEGADVDSFLIKKSNALYSDTYLDSVTSEHSDPLLPYHTIAYYWHSIIRFLISIITNTWMKHPSEGSMALRIAIYSSLGMSSAAAAATVQHIRSILLFQMAEDGWPHTAIREAENCRMHTLIMFDIAQPSFITRLLLLLLQVVSYFQMISIHSFFPSVAYSYAAYRAEEQVRNTTHVLHMMQSGKAHSVLAPQKPAPSLARSYYGLKERATVRDVVVRIRADDACNKHMSFVFADMFPGQGNPFETMKNE